MNRHTAILLTVILGLQGCSRPPAPTHDIVAVPSVDLGFAADLPRIIPYPGMFLRSDERDHGFESLLSDGETVWARGLQGIMRLDLDTQKMELIYTPPESSSCSDLVSPAKGVLVVRLDNGALVRIDAETGESSVLLPAPESRWERGSLASLSDGTLVFRSRISRFESDGRNVSYDKLIELKMADGSQTQLPVDLKDDGTVRDIMGSGDAPVFVVRTVLEGTYNLKAIAFNRFYERMWDQVVNSGLGAMSHDGKVAYQIEGSGPQSYVAAIVGPNVIPLHVSPDNRSPFAWFDNDHLIVVDYKCVDVYKISTGERQRVKEWDDSPTHVVFNEATGDLVFLRHPKGVGVLRLVREAPEVSLP